MREWRRGEGREKKQKQKEKKGEKLGRVNSLRDTFGRKTGKAFL